ncbi:hypothetical protein HFO77_29185 [Rhizobium leguminosarum]|uniref:hypothetical protein n=1 Tax=Rhizobium leguminosarum TaxID=384 RepID=UPI001C94868D|nr:hypothetical protein [Rhizobium leguminosarum]MBY5918469.1 hypothetical protein [Rhizobium leguminosarum]
MSKTISKSENGLQYLRCMNLLAPFLRQRPSSESCMLIDVDKLDRALDRSIEAAVDHSGWPDVPQSIAKATNAFRANIPALRGIFPGGIVTTQSLGPALESYFNGGRHLNEWRLRGPPLLMRQAPPLRTLPAETTFICSHFTATSGVADWAEPARLFSQHLTAPW